MPDERSQQELGAGDLCHHGSNLLPTYRVIWIDDGKVWLRDVNSGKDAVVDTAQCHKLRAALAPGAELSEPSEKPSGPTWPDGTPRP